MRHALRPRHTFTAAPFAVRIAIVAALATLPAWHSVAHADWVPSGLTGHQVRAASEPRPGVVFSGVADGLQRSLDGGVSWMAVGSWDFSDAYACESALDSGQVFVAVESGVYRSDNSGENWSFFGYALVGTYSLGVAPNGDVWAAGAAGTWRSTDRGRNWTRVHDAMGSYLHGLAIDADGRVFVTTMANEVLRTTDSGATWETLPIAPNAVVALAVSPRTGAVFLGAQNAGSPATFTVLRSTDHGDSWQPVLTQPGTLNVLSFVHNGDLWVGANAVAYSSDDGATWTSRDAGRPSNSPPVAFSEIGGYVYAGFDLGGLWRWDKAITSVPAPRIAGLAMSIAPVPAAGTARVRLTLPAAGRYTLEMLDVAGRRVARLSIEAAGPGVHELPLDVRGWRAGVYLARLVSRGATAATVRVPVL